MTGHEKKSKIVSQAILEQRGKFTVEDVVNSVRNLIEGSVDLPRDEKVKPYDLYFCLSKGHFFNVVDRLSKVVEEYRKKENTQVDRVIDVSKDVDPNSGLVL